MLLSQTELSQVPPSLWVQGGVGIIMVGVLMWAVARLIKMFEDMREADAKRTELTITFLRDTLAEVRKTESTRTDAAIERLMIPINMLSELAKAQVVTLGAMTNTAEKSRDVLHGVRNLKFAYEAQAEKPGDS